jgi:hypothetical protein
MSSSVSAIRIGIFIALAFRSDNFFPSRNTDRDNISALEECASSDSSPERTLILTLLSLSHLLGPAR